MEQRNGITTLPQYSVGKILLIWAAAGGSIIQPEMQSPCQRIDRAFFKAG